MWGFGLQSQFGTRLSLSRVEWHVTIHLSGSCLPSLEGAWENETSLASPPVFDGSQLRAFWGQGF